jgi:hypothetical protein
MTIETAGEGSSPACSMHQADDVYMGYIAQEELIAFSTNCSKRCAPALRSLSKALAQRVAAGLRN